jgi:hypothetical protein
MQGATTMPNADIPAPSADMQRRLEIADAQSILYTRDYKRSVDAECQAECQKASKLTAANQQLQAYARNLKMAFNAARSMTRELGKVDHDTLRSQRPYKPAFDHARTCDIILNGDGRRRPELLDPRLLKAFRTIHQVFEAIYC